MDKDDENDRAETRPGSTVPASGQYTWEDLHELHESIQERASRFVASLSKEKDFFERQTALLTSILESAGDGILVLDNDGRLLLHNQAAENMLGFPLDGLTSDYVTSRIDMFLSDRTTPLPADRRPMQQALAGRQAELIAFTRDKESGRERWFRINATPILDRNRTIYGAVCTFHDITKQQELLEQRNVLAAIITHDLKNHLAGVASLTDVIISGNYGAVPAGLDYPLRLLKSGADNHLNVIKNLVEIYQYESGAQVLKFTTADLTGPLAGWVAESLPALEFHGLSADVRLAEALDPVSVDVRALRHVFSNLVDNAMKFTPAGGKISVESRNDQGNVVIEVTDTGSGIPESELSLLFTGVGRPIPSHRSVGSTGLGLYLCKRLLDAHGASIECRTTAGAGTSFTIRIPKAAPG